MEFRLHGCLTPVVIVLLALAVAMSLLLSACTGGGTQERTFQLEIQDESLVQEESVLEVKQGDMVTMVVASDVPLSFHLHGYDIEKEAKPGEPATLEFTADATGSFRFTIHVEAESQEEEGQHEEDEETEHEEGEETEHEEGEEEDIELGRLEVQPR